MLANILKPYLDRWEICSDTAIIEAGYREGSSYERLANFIEYPDFDLDGRVLFLGPTFSIENLSDFLAGAMAGKIVVPYSNLRTRDVVPTEHPLYDKVESGLILVSSGSTGTPKIALHDMELFLAKFMVKKRPAKRTIAFLLWDHIGGLNTALHTLFNGGILVIPKDHDPVTVKQTVNKYDVQVLPTTPTFLRLLVMAGQTDMPSLERITYGTEPMHPETLTLVRHAFPKVELQQTYGASEIGILSTKSESNESLWMRMGGPGFETRVVNGLLEIKADTAMVGYLNAPSPFTEDGWYKTGDEVEVRDGFYRIKGRASNVINVGGLKVHPAEIENVLLGAGAEQASVKGMPNPIMGEVPVAYVVGGEFLVLRHACAEKLEQYKRPVRFIRMDSLTSDRFKTI